MTTSLRWTRILFIALLLVAALQCWYYYPLLPDIVASHFDGAGTPNNWSSKNAFFLIYGLILLLCIGIFLLLPLCFEWLPERSLNLPNKKYWLAPQRRVQTFAFMKLGLLVFGLASLLLGIAVMQEAMIANLQPESDLSDRVWGYLIAYFVFVAVWLAVFIRRFYRTG